MPRTNISYRGLGVDTSVVAGLQQEQEQLQVQIDENNKKNAQLRKERALQDQEEEAVYNLIDQAEATSSPLSEEAGKRGRKTINMETQINDTQKPNWGSAFAAPQESETAKKYKELMQQFKDNPDNPPDILGLTKDAKKDFGIDTDIQNHHVNKAKMGGWGSKMKKAGAIGLGAIVAGGVIANLMGNGGQQTNAQLYGQQPIY